MVKYLLLQNSKIRVDLFSKKIKMFKLKREATWQTTHLMAKNYMIEEDTGLARLMVISFEMAMGEEWVRLMVISFEMATGEEWVNLTEGLFAIHMDREYQPLMMSKKSLMESVVHHWLQCGFSSFVKNFLHCAL